MRNVRTKGSRFFATSFGAVPKPRSRLKRQLLERLESRVLLTMVITVNDARDLSDPLPTSSNHTIDVDPAMPGNQVTLRAALENYNDRFRGTSETVFRIEFALGAGNPTIHVVNGTLPPILAPSGETATLTIDGHTGGATRVELDGTGAGSLTTGLSIRGANITVAGMVINRFGRHGIVIGGTPSPGGGHDVVKNCYIGTDSAGTTDRGNGGDGILIEGGTANNTIGGTSDADRNVISGNGGDGIHIEGRNPFGPTLNASDNGNTIIHNYIGLNAGGTAGLGNSQDGVFVEGDPGVADFRTRPSSIGDASGNGNVISGNFGDGVRIQGYFASSAGAAGIPVRGNRIGTDAAGTNEVANLENGVHISGSSRNSIGAAGAGNTISGNGGDGVLIEVDGSTLNMVQGNSIGTNASGTAAIANDGCGVRLDEVSSNTIGGSGGAGNTISGNGEDGINISGVAMKAASSNTVQGNFIGVGSNGLTRIANGGDGVRIEGQAFDNTIGGAGSGNVLSGNSGNGLGLVGDADEEIFPFTNEVFGNFIGTDMGGSVNVGNGQNGVLLLNIGNGFNIIGGAGAKANVISGNSRHGVASSGSIQNDIMGNFIGTDKTGTAALGNGGDGIFILSSMCINVGRPGAGNIISGNDGNGIRMVGAVGDETSMNPVMSNFIGTDKTGMARLANGGDGVQLTDAASNTIGGVVPGEGNLISGNGGNGVAITSANPLADTNENLIQGNFIGSDITGMGPLGNALDGVRITLASENGVGGAAGGGNLVSGNGGNGIAVIDTLMGLGTKNNVIDGNLIGVTINGLAAMGNGLDGVLVTDAQITQIQSNTISGNSGNGVRITGVARFTAVTDNFVGVDGNGGLAVANGGDGVRIVDATDTTVSDNTLSGNSGHGLQIISSQPIALLTMVEGNFIGTDKTGLFAVPNVQDGVHIVGASKNTIGVAGAGNVISGNLGNGIQISGAGALGNIVQGNNIGLDDNNGFLGNRGNGVLIVDAPNNMIGAANGSGNRISDNAGAGIMVQGVTATGNNLRFNSLTLNGKLGIDLGGDGVTPNDTGDPDAGPNNLQNFPVLTSILTRTPLPGQPQRPTLVTGSLNGTPNTAFRIDLYLCAVQDGSGFGEGDTFYFTDTETTDASGNVNFSIVVPVIAVGTVVTATATDPSGNTSEFSAAKQVEEAATLLGTKFNDLNGDGTRQIGEPGLENWTIYVDTNNNGQPDPGELKTMTASSGAYVFDALPAGVYIVREVLQSGWTQTRPAAGFYNVVVTQGQLVPDLDFGNQQTTVFPPLTGSGVINGGAQQRSMVTSINYTFSHAVTLDAGAFELTRIGLVGGGPASDAISISVTTADNIHFQITFTGAGIISGSLADGRYRLLLHGDHVHDAFGQTLAADDTINFGRLFGDADGNGVVDGSDLRAFQMAASQPTAPASLIFDYDGNGTVDSADLAQFRARYGRRL